MRPLQRVSGAGSSAAAAAAAVPWREGLGMGNELFGEGSVPAVELPSPDLVTSGGALGVTSVVLFSRDLVTSGET